MTVIFTYRNYQGAMRRFHVRFCSDPAGTAAALSAMLDTEVQVTALEQLAAR